MKYLCLLIFAVLYQSPSRAADPSKIVDYKLTITTRNEKFTGNLEIGLNLGSTESFEINVGSNLEITGCTYTKSTEGKVRCTKIENKAGKVKYGVPGIDTSKKVEISYEGKYDEEGLSKETFNGKSYFFAHFANGHPEKVLPSSKDDDGLVGFILKPEENIMQNINDINQGTEQEIKVRLKKIAFVLGPTHIVGHEDVSQNIPKLNLKGVENGWKITKSAESFIRDMWKKITSELGIDEPLNKLQQLVLPRSPARDINGKYLSTQSLRNILLEDNIGVFHEQSIRTSLIQQLWQQWFGSDVIASDKWLNKGLSTFLAYYNLDQTSANQKGNLGPLDLFLVDQLQLRAFEADGFTSAVPLKKFNETSTTYDGVLPDAILYSKGASIMRSLMFVCGKQKFRDGLTNWLKRKMEKTANVDSFAEDFKECFNPEVNSKNFFNQWHTLPGYPVVHLTAGNAKSETFTLTQERFTWTKNDDKKCTWQFEVACKTSKEKEVSIWMSSEKESLNVEKSDWIILNHGSRGYYRVNYDMKTWNAIISQLLSDHKKIDETDRARIIDDLFSFARSVGKFSQPTPDYAMAFKLFNYLKKEKSYIPLKAAFNAFEFVESALAGSEAYAPFTSRVKFVVEELYNGLAQNAENTGIFKKLLAREVTSWACRLGVAKCIKEAESYYSKWNAARENNQTQPDVEDIFLCTAVSKSADKWIAVFGAMLSEKNIHRVLAYINALGCNVDSNLLKILLEETKQRLGNEHFFDIFSSVGKGNSENVIKLLKYLDERKKDISPGAMEKVVQLILRKLNKSGGEELSRFVRSNLPENNKVRSEAETAVTAIKEWNDKKAASIAKYFKSGESRTNPVVFIVALSALLPFVNYYSTY